MKPAIVIEHRDLTEIARTINAEHAAVSEFLGKALNRARRAGDALLQAKGELPHGQFGPWLKANCPFSERTARNYMKVSQNWLTIEASAATSVREAVLVLAEDSDGKVPQLVVEPLEVQTVSTFSETAALPFSLPPVGMGVVGIVGDIDRMPDATIVYIESVGDSWFRAAIAGKILHYQGRALNRIHFGLWFDVIHQEWGYGPEFWSRVNWLAPEPLANDSNPLAKLLPWWYDNKVPVHHKVAAEETLVVHG